jgi:hypothetical protein
MPFIKIFNLKALELTRLMDYLSIQNCVCIIFFTLALDMKYKLNN